MKEWRKAVLDQHRAHPDRLIGLCRSTGIMEIYEEGEKIGNAQERPAPKMFGIASVYADAIVNCLLAIQASGQNPAPVAKHFGIDFHADLESHEPVEPEPPADAG
jgi:hypothetical protein